MAAKKSSASAKKRSVAKKASTSSKKSGAKKSSTRAGATWKAHTRHATLDTADRKQLPNSVYAFPNKRKEPMTDASHVRNAMARFDQVKGVSDEDRDQAWANIKKAAGHYKIDVEEKSWRELGKKPHTNNPAH